MIIVTNNILSLSFLIAKMNEDNLFERLECLAHNIEEENKQSLQQKEKAHQHCVQCHWKCNFYSQNPSSSKFQLCKTKPCIRSMANFGGRVQQVSLVLVEKQIDTCLPFKSKVSIWNYKIFVGHKLWSIGVMYRLYIQTQLAMFNFLPSCILVTSGNYITTNVNVASNQ